MGAKHVPVSRVSAINLKDPKNNREAVKDPRFTNKWVYKLKIQARGSIDPLKANLVARGDEQVYGVDCTYTFLAVMEMISGKVMLLCQGYGDRKDDLEILLYISQGMNIDATKKHGVRDKRQLTLRLKKRLYDLKQSGRLWYLILHDV
ncbi:unnamed protein product [Peronospora belbahrii]|uniref:Reverse transcriptase Ty1/copia-type domain-containing protein n=1 Tax=Peronospora belbahrii TaxID=622444 RepID=A0ABN8D550_9STRA|nr:unnamed protein product [Peronospora belbahrii]